MATKINPTTQIQKGNNETYLKSTNSGITWSPINYATPEQVQNIKNALEQKDNELKSLIDDNTKKIGDIEVGGQDNKRLIEEAVREATKNINTAKFVAPVQNISEVPLDSVDDNDLVLVGNTAPYTIYAKVGGEFVQLGSTDVDLSKYATTEQLQQAKDDIANNVVTPMLDNAKHEATEEAVRKIGDTIEDKINTAVGEMRSEVSKVEDTVRQSLKTEIDKISFISQQGVFFANGGETDISVNLMGFGNINKQSVLQELVYLNGVLQTPNNDFIYSGNNNSVIPEGNTATMSFISPLEDGDSVQVIAVGLNKE